MAVFCRLKNYHWLKHRWWIIVGSFYFYEFGVFSMQCLLTFHCVTWVVRCPLFTDCKVCSNPPTGFVISLWEFKLWSLIYNFSLAPKHEHMRWIFSACLIFGRIETAVRCEVHLGAICFRLRFSNEFKCHSCTISEWTYCAKRFHFTGLRDFNLQGCELIPFGILRGQVWLLGRCFLVENVARDL